MTYGDDKRHTHVYTHIHIHGKVCFATTHSLVCVECEKERGRERVTDGKWSIVLHVSLVVCTVCGVCVVYVYVCVLLPSSVTGD